MSVGTPSPQSNKEGNLFPQGDIYALCNQLKHPDPELIPVTAEVQRTTQSMQCNLILLILRSPIVFWIESNIWVDRTQSLI